MKTKIFPLFCLFLFSTSRVFAGYSLQDCLEIAAENSQKINISDIRVLIEDDRIDEAWGPALPRLTAQGDYIAAGEARTFFKKHKRLNGKASLLVPIYNFGGYFNSITAQEKIFEAANYKNTQVKQEVIYSVTQAYYRLLEAQKIEIVIKDSISRLKAQYRISKDFHSQGLLHESETLLVEVELAEREQDLIRAIQNIAISKICLNRVMGIDQKSPLEIDDVLEDITDSQDLESILCASKNCNPELQACQLQVEAAYYAWKGEKGALYPSIYAYSDYSTTNDYALPYVHGVSVGLGVQMNLYDATSRAKIKRKEKEWMELQQICNSMEQDLELRIRTAYLRLESAANQIPVALKGTKLAQENLKNTMDQFKEGLVTSYDLLNDEERVTHARSNYYQALYDYHKAQSELAFASGICQ